MRGLVAAFGWMSAAGLSAIAVVSVRDWMRERTPSRAALALALLMLATTALIGRLGVVLDQPSTFMAPLVIFAFELSGLFLLVFRGSFIPLRRATLIAAAAAVATSVLTFVVVGVPNVGSGPTPVQSLAIAMLVAVWVACVGEPTLRLWLASRGRPAVQRARLRALAAAYGAILLVLLISAGPQSIATNDAVRAAVAGLGLLVVPLLYTGFAPPRWLRRAWGRREEESAKHGITELLAFAPDRHRLAERALESAMCLVGAEAGMVVEAGGAVLATSGIDEDEAAKILAEIGALDQPRTVMLASNPHVSTVVVPVHSEEAPAALVVRAGPFTPIFGSDEVQRLDEYGAAIAVTFDRVHQSVRYSSFLQAVSDIGEGLVITEAGRPVYVNDAYSAITGYSVQELMALPSLLDLAPPELRAGLATRLADRLAGGDVPDQYLSELITKDGRRVEVESAVRHMEANGGNKVIALVRDVSERIRAQDALRESEARLQLIIDNALSAVVTMDSGGLIAGWSARAEETFGWRKEVVLGRSLAETLIPEPMREAHTRGMARFLATGRSSVLGTVLEMSALHRDGHEFPVELAISPALEANGTPFFVAFIRDVSDRKRRENLQIMQFAVTRILSDSHSIEEAAPHLLKVMADSLGCQVGGVWLMESGGEQMSMRYSWQSSSLDRRGYERASRKAPMARGQGLPGRVWVTREPVAIADMAAETAFPLAGAAHEMGLHGAVGFPIFADDRVVGMVEFLSHAVCTLDHDILAVMADAGRQIGQFIERRRAEAALRESIAQLAEVAATDPLTGLRNRREFERQLNTIPRRNFAVLAIDVDNLKQTNDEYGHEAGDVLLKAVALTLASLLRGWDLVARVGGDEFAALLIDANGSDAAKAGERMRTAVHSIAVPYGRARISVGWATGPAGADPNAIWRQADIDLYRAKREGRDRVRGGGIAREGAVEPSGWASRVDQALSARRISVLYQPIVRLSDGRVVGHEALARPEGCAASDRVDDFFAEAVRIGRIRDIDWLCRRMAIEGAPWPAPPDWTLFVNVRTVTLLDPVHDVDQLLLLLRAVGGTPEQIVLEITEHEIISDLARLRLVLAAYREQGFRFAIDDVGEGHSTLELLAAANAEFIKIARSLTTTASRSGSRSAIRAAVAFAESSGAALLAEGLESEFAVEQMRDFGVTLGQGWQLGRPGPIEPGDARMVRHGAVDGGVRARSGRSAVKAGQRGAGGGGGGGLWTAGDGDSDAVGALRPRSSRSSSRSVS